MRKTSASKIQLVLLILLAADCPAFAHGEFLIGLPILASHFLAVFLIGVLLLFWRERFLLRAAVFVLALFSLVATLSLLPNVQKLWKWEIWQLIFAGAITPTATALLSYYGVRHWRTKHGESIISRE